MIVMSHNMIASSDNISIGSEVSVDTPDFESLSLSTTSNGAASSTSSTSIDNLDFRRSILNTRYTRFERYFSRLIILGRNVLAKDRTFERPGLHFSYVGEYFHLRDRIRKWFTKPSNTALFLTYDSYSYVMQIVGLMGTFERALALPPVVIAWPGVEFAPCSVLLNVQIQAMYCEVDSFLFDGQELKIESLPWNSEGHVGMTG
jgi:hypothetical protein